MGSHPEAVFIHHNVAGRQRAIVNLADAGDVPSVHATIIMVYTRSFLCMIVD